MDDLYDNLDNYNEEQTIAELQTENKELKSKLEEYASTLDKLQKDFDKLSSEYKKLELNYSSLLKTAKAEIERKTQIITNLNLEKDKMVLQSFQNKNAINVHRSRAYDRPILAKTYAEDRDNMNTENDIKIKEIERSRTQSPHTATERKEQAYFPPKDATTIANQDIGSKLLNIANSVTRQVDPRNEKNSNVRDNIPQPKKDNDAFKSRALIKNRRKSMPAVSIDMEKISSDDDELPSAGSSKDFSRENTDRRHVDRHFSERQSSRISEASSLEDRNSRYHESLPDAHKRRHSRHDNDRLNRHRMRDKSSHRYKRHSPDRYQKEYKYYHNDPYNRSEYDRHRSIESPPYDKYHWQQSRESHRSNYERSHHEHERLQHPRLDKYPTKHKIEHSYDESDCKRIKIESHHRSLNENRRLHDERKCMETTLITEPFGNVQFLSCESPDYNHSEVSSHQIREIKLTATTKLDDPRIYNKKYILKKIDGKVELSTAEGRNVDMVSVNKAAWRMKTVSMPEALLRRPSLESLEAKQSSMESGEICEGDSLLTQTSSKEILNESKIPKIDEKEKSVKQDTAKDIERTSQRFNSYKIPKLKKTIDEKPSRKNKEITLVKPVHEKTHIDSNSESVIKDIIGGSMPLINKIKEKSLAVKKKDEGWFIKSNNELPFLGTSDLYDKQEVENDLELSDDTWDINEQPNQIENTRLEKNKKDISCNIDIVKLTTAAMEMNVENVTCNQIGNMSREHKHERVSVEPFKDKIIDDIKKSKHKKKPKYKESKEECDSKDLAQLSQKPPRRKEKEKQTKTKQIRTKFSELFDDSSSLISPEDLGLTAVPATQLPDKSIPFSEDAQDVENLNAINLVQDLIPSEKLHGKDDKLSKKIKVNPVSAVSLKSIDKTNNGQPEINERVVENIYKNIDPSIPEMTVTGSLTSEKLHGQDNVHHSNNYANAVNEESVNKTNNVEPAIDERDIENIYKNIEPGILETAVKDLIPLEKLHGQNNEQHSNNCANAVSQESVNKTNDVQPALDERDIENIYKNIEPGILETAVKDLIPPEKPYEDNEHDDNLKKTKVKSAHAVSRESMDKIIDAQPAIDERVIDNIYKNVEPDIPEKDVVKTVIISSGVQSQVSIGIEKKELPSESQITTASKAIVLKALATSTPQKMWQPDVVQDNIEAKLPETSCNSNDSLIASVENTVALDNSDTKTLDSQASTDVPDVRIFVRRRRKLIKK